jgi:hypothetical protein
MSQLNNTEDTTWEDLKTMVVANDADNLDGALSMMSIEWGLSQDEIKDIVNQRDATGKTLLGYASSDEVKDVLREVGATNGGSRKRRNTKRRDNKRRNTKRRDNKRRDNKRRNTKRRDNKRRDNKRH